MSDLDRLIAYAYFHGRVKGWTEIVEQGYGTPEAAIDALQIASAALDQKLATSIPAPAESQQ